MCNYVAYNRFYKRRFLYIYQLVLPSQHPVLARHSLRPLRRRQNVFASEDFCRNRAILIRTVQCNRGFTLVSRSDTVIVVHSLKGGSTAHALASVLHSWQTALDKGQSVGSSLVDFSKAVDRVNHNILLQKLLRRQVPHDLLRWIFL